MLNNEPSVQDTCSHGKVFLLSLTSVFHSRVVIKVQKESDDDLKERRICLFERKIFQEGNRRMIGEKRKER